MSGTDKPLTRDALISMEVIDAKGRKVGKVNDLAFSVGKNGISLTVENADGETQDVPWDEVQAAADYIILKPQMQSAAQPAHQQPVQTAVPAQSAQQQSTSPPLCPTCGKPLTWIPQYQRWYCYNDKKYA